MALYKLGKKQVIYVCESNTFLGGTATKCQALAFSCGTELQNWGGIALVIIFIIRIKPRQSLPGKILQHCVSGHRKLPQKPQGRLSKSVGPGSRCRSLANALEELPELDEEVVAVFRQRRRRRRRRQCRHRSRF